MSEEPAEQPQAYIYGLRDKDSETYFYIGSTKFTPSTRLQHHWARIRAGRNTNRRFCRKMKQLGRDRVVVDTIETVASTDRFLVEFALINELLTSGVPLTNSSVQMHEKSRAALAAVFKERLFFYLTIPRRAPNPRDQRQVDSLLKFMDRWWLIMWHRFPSEMSDLLEAMPK